MEISNIPIPGHEKDNVIIITRRHIVSVLSTVMIILFMIIVPLIIVLAMIKTNPVVLNTVIVNFLVVGGSIYYLIVATFALTQWISYYYDIFIVTDKEVLDIAQDGLFDRRITEISLLRIQDVSARIKGFFPTLFGYGDVVAESAGENSRTYIIDSIPRPVEVANKILSLHNESIEREERAAEVITAEGDLRSHQQGNLVKSSLNQQSEKVCEPCPECAPVRQENIIQGEVKKEDLNGGGEVNFRG